MRTVPLPGTHLRKVKTWEIPSFAMSCPPGQLSRIASVLQLLRHRSRQLSWIALLAIFGLAFAPTISRAFSHQGGANATWAEVCTPQGAQWVAVQDSAGSSAPGPAGALAFGHLDHCPLCGLGASAALLPPLVSVLVLASPLAQSLPPLFLQAQRPQFAWRAPAPRGPPSLI